MKAVKLFESTANADEVFSEVVSAGIAGVYGGRVSVRNLAGQVGRLAEEEGICAGEEEGYISTGLTYNHPRTELAYMFDAKKFSADDALQIVVEAFENAHPYSE